MTGRPEVGERVDIQIKGVRVEYAGHNIRVDINGYGSLTVPASHPDITVTPTPPVVVYFIHDTLTPHNVRVTREMQTVPAVGDVLEFDSAGYMGAKATWRVAKVEEYPTGNVTCRMTDAADPAVTP